MTKTYSFLKVVEGGNVSQREALELLADARIVARPASTPYIGHTAVAVDGGRRQQKQAERICFGLPTYTIKGGR